MSHTAASSARGSFAAVDGETQGLTVTWIWDSESPFDVRAGFHVDGDTRPVWWVLPRDFLLRAVTCTCKLGGDQVTVQRIADALCIALEARFPDTEAAFVLTACDPLRDVLVESYARVAPGREPVDVDGALAQILESAS